jgi:hypothetical protein
VPELTALANASANLDCARAKNDSRRCDLLNDEASNRVAFAQSHEFVRFFQANPRGTARRIGMP